MLGVVVNCKKPVLDSPGYVEVRTARAGSNSLPPVPYQTPAFRHTPSGEMFPLHGLNSSLIACAISYLRRAKTIPLIANDSATTKHGHFGARFGCGCRIG